MVVFRVVRPSEASAEPKICGELDVFWLNIAVDEAHLVHTVHCAHQLAVHNLKYDNCQSPSPKSSLPTPNPNPKPKEVPKPKVQLGIRGDTKITILNIKWQKLSGPSLFYFL